MKRWARWIRRVVIAIIVAAISLVILTAVVVALAFYGWAHQYDSEKAAMASLLAHGLPKGVGLAMVKRFVYSQDFGAFQRAHHFDDLYIDNRPTSVPTYIANNPGEDQGFPQSDTALGIELKRGTDDVTMMITILFDGGGRYTRAAVDESGPSL